MKIALFPSGSWGSFGSAVAGYDQDDIYSTCSCYGNSRLNPRREPKAEGNKVAYGLRQMSS
jgi:hypothetical protein